MRGAASHLAAVADGSGRVLGLAALEDVLEMLVGEVHDPAHEAAGAPPQQRSRPPAVAGERGSGVNSAPEKETSAAPAG
jgi:CBS domain containing-hemolysin-like protein